MTMPVEAKATAAQGPSPWPWILLATLAGAIVRVAPVLRADFPLGDGGMFASIVDEIRRTGDLIPTWITYNNLNAPFGYPPLSFVVTAGLDYLIPIGTVEWLRWIPLVASIATVPAYSLLASVLAPSRTHVVVATFVFALVPGSFEWLIMGGGLTRAPGFLLAILTLYLWIRFLKLGGRAWIGAGVGLGLAVLTHPNAGLFTAIGMSLAAIAYGRDGRTWGRVIATAAIGVAVSMPWIVTVVARHEIAILIAAGGTSPNLWQSVYTILTASVTGEPFWRLAAGLGVLGYLYAVFRRWYFLPAWAAIIALADPRATITYAAVPMSVLAAVGLLDVVTARLLHLAGEIRAAPGWPGAVLRRRSVRAILGVALSLGLMSALLAPYVIGPLTSIDSDQRSAMAWSRGAIPSTARVLVVTDLPWYGQTTAEWFPYLAGRESVATVQGYEWLGSAAWQRQLELADALREHANDTVAALDEWADEFGVVYDYVYLPKGQLGGVMSAEDCCRALRSTLRDSADYEIVYDGVGATIARRLGS